MTPIRIVPCYFHAVAGRWVACLPREAKRATGFFVARGTEAVGFAPTRAEAEAVVGKLCRTAT